MRNELFILVGILLLALLMVLGVPKKPVSSDTQDDTITVTITVTTSSVWDQSKPLKEIDSSLMQHLRQRDITVYFEPGQRRLAQDVVHALGKAWHIVA